MPAAAPMREHGTPAEQPTEEFPAGNAAIIPSEIPAFTIVIARPRRSAGMSCAVTASDMDQKPATARPSSSRERGHELASDESKDAEAERDDGKPGCWRSACRADFAADRGCSRTGRAGLR